MICKKDINQRTFIFSSAQSFGFGPASKLVTLIRHLSNYQHIFVGDGIALGFVNKNLPHLTTIPLAELDVFLAKLPCDAKCRALVVMEPFMAYSFKVRKIPVAFVDSLLGFWRLDHSFSEVVKSGKSIVDDIYTFNDAVLKYSFHELEVLAHLFSDWTFCQVGFGTKERLKLLKSFGIERAFLTAPIVEENFLQDNIANSDKCFLINLGGISNPFTSAETAELYLDLIRGCILETIKRYREWGIDSVIFAHGASKEMRVYEHDGMTVQEGWMDHTDFLKKLQACAYFASAPGLTAVYEAAKYGKKIILLPEQHYGHYLNMQALCNTQLCSSKLSWFDFADSGPPPAEDKAGTEYIHALLRDVRSSRLKLETFLFRFTKAFHQTLEHVELKPQSLHQGLNFSETIATLKRCFEFYV